MAMLKKRKKAKATKATAKKAGARKRSGKNVVAARSKTKRASGAAKSPSRRSREGKPGDGFLTWKEVRRAFGNIYAMADSPTHASWNYSKFDFISGALTKPAGEDRDAAIYLLAAYCFDLHLRMVYIVEALSHVGGVDADKEFATRVESELHAINGSPPGPGVTEKSWKDMAKDAYATMAAAHGRIEAKRNKILEKALGPA